MTSRIQEILYENTGANAGFSLGYSLSKIVCSEETDNIIQNALL